MAEVRETKLPGVGVRHEFTAHDGTVVGVVEHHDGRLELIRWRDQMKPERPHAIAGREVEIAA